MSEAIRIIRIVSDSEFIIDAGSLYGVKIGQRFDIIDPDLNPITDLDGNRLGNLGATKATLTATDIRESFSILRTDKVPFNNDNPFSTPILPNAKYFSRVKIDPSDMEPLDTTDAPIHKGDIAILNDK